MLLVLACSQWDSDPVPWVTVQVQLESSFEKVFDAIPELASLRTAGVLHVLKLYVAVPHISYSEEFYGSGVSVLNDMRFAQSVVEDGSCVRLTFTARNLDKVLLPDSLTLLKRASPSPAVVTADPAHAYLNTNSGILHRSNCRALKQVKKGSFVIVTMSELGGGPEKWCGICCADGNP